MGRVCVRVLVQKNRTLEEHLDLPQARIRVSENKWGQSGASVFENASACHEYGLNAANASMCANGHYKHSQGYVFEWV